MSAAAAEGKCLTIEEAPKNIGATACVTGKVLKVVELDSGVTFLNFCDDYKTCPFTVVVFASNYRDVGDVKWLEGKVIEIHGKIQTYKDRPQIVLRDVKQLKGEAAKIPAMPREYDAERRGSHSAGEFKKK